MGNAAPRRDLVFVSYSHLDRDWLDKLSRILKGYARRGLLELWTDDYLRVGDVWRREIHGALNRARVGVLLLSSDFTGSDFIMDEELPALLRAAEAGHLTLVCILVRPVDHDLIPEVQSYQWAGYPKDPKRSLDKLSTPELEEALVRAGKVIADSFRQTELESVAVTDSNRTRALAANVVQPAVSALSANIATKGLLHGVPPLPQHFVARAAALDPLKRALLEDSRQRFGISASGREGLHGQGGIGKTVLATALVHDPEVQRAFADGVFWVTLGQTPDLIELQRWLAHALTGERPDFETHHVGAKVLRDTCADRNCLLVLDDVWQAGHAEVFQILGPRGRLLVTTRDRALLDALGARIQSVEKLEPEDAHALLAHWANSDPERLPPAAAEVARECGYLPLALALAGAQVRGGAPWQDVLEALERGNLRFLDHPHGSILKSLSASVSALSEAEAARYAELAIFPEDAAIPASVIEKLWSASGLDPLAARKLLRRFAQRALLTLEGDSPAQAVRFHDLQGDYLRLLLREPQHAHARLLDAYEATLPAHADPSERWSAPALRTLPLAALRPPRPRSRPSHSRRGLCHRRPLARRKNRRLRYLSPPERSQARRRPNRQGALAHDRTRRPTRELLAAPGSERAARSLVSAPAR